MNGNRRHAYSPYRLPASIRRFRRPPTAVRTGEAKLYDANHNGFSGQSHGVK